MYKFPWSYSIDCINGLATVLVACSCCGIGSYGLEINFGVSYV